MFSVNECILAALICAVASDVSQEHKGWWVFLSIANIVAAFVKDAMAHGAVR